MKKYAEDQVLDEEIKKKYQDLMDLQIKDNNLEAKEGKQNIKTLIAEIKEEYLSDLNPDDYQDSDVASDDEEQKKESSSPSDVPTSD